MKYVVQTPVALDGKLYAEGDQVDLNKQDGAALLACGAVREMDKEAAKEVAKK